MNNPLTDKEMQILRDAAHGFTARQSAEKHHRSYDTIKSHRSKVLQKLRAHSMAEAVYNYARWWGIEGLIMMVALIFASCQQEDWCTCEIITNKDPDYITFMMKGCHYCCWYATIEACPLTQIDSIGDQFYQRTIQDDTVCLWEGADWTWEYGRVL